MKPEVEAMASWLLEIRRVTRAWPKTVIVHPSGRIEDAVEAVRIAHQRQTTIDDDPSLEDNAEA